MLKEPIDKRYQADGKEAIDLTADQLVARNRINGKLLSKEYQVEDVFCHLCGGDGQRCISEKDVYGLPVRVVICNHCGLIYNSPCLTKACLPKFYNEDYRKLDRVLPSTETYYELEFGKGRRIYNFLLDHEIQSKLEGKLIIDIGCGAGGVLGYFKQAGYDVLGCDLVRHHLEFGRNERLLELYYGNLDTIINIVSSLSIEVGLVIYEQVFEHLREPSAELNKLHELMGPNTFLFIGVPGVRNIDAHYDSDLLRFLQLPHLVHFDLEHLIALLELNSFEFLFGNEIVQAVFKKTTKRASFRMPNVSSMEKFISELEHRRNKRAVTGWVLKMPLKLGIALKAKIERLPLPMPYKEGLIKSIRYIRRLIG